MATIQVRVDDQLKEDAEAIFSTVGIDMPTAIRAFLKQSVLHRGLPFELRADPHGVYIDLALREANKEAKANPARLSYEEFRAKTENLFHELQD